MWKLPHRLRAAFTTPLEVVEANQDRIFERGLFNQSLDVLKKPEPLLRRRMQVAQRVRGGEGPLTLEKRAVERAHREGAADRFGGSLTDPK